jgi:hypothetical protein
MHCLSRSHWFTLVAVSANALVVRMAATPTKLAGFRIGQTARQPTRVTPIERCSAGALCGPNSPPQVPEAAHAAGGLYIMPLCKGARRGPWRGPGRVPEVIAALGPWRITCNVIGQARLDFVHARRRTPSARPWLGVARAHHLGSRGGPELTRAGVQLVWDGRRAPMLGAGGGKSDSSERAYKPSR